MKELVDLNEYSFPEGMKSITKQHISFFSNLKKIKIPLSVEYIESHAFDNYEIEEIESDPKWISLFSNGERTLNTFKCIEGVEELTDLNFQQYNVFENLSIPSTVTRIENVKLRFNMKSFTGDLKYLSNLMEYRFDKIILPNIFPYIQTMEIYLLMSHNQEE